jgi:deoxyribodipyrimidine photo-lyase
MIVASFFTKNLWLDWRLGEEFFAQYLMDYELSSNVGGWQWSASVGTDAQPYFRVFNPYLQSKNFDSDGSYIRKYLPGLASLSDSEIHMPKSLFSPKYSRPIVDYEQSRKDAIDKFKRLKAY